MKGRKPPAEPADLAQHSCAMLGAKNNEADWHLISGRKKVKVRVSGPISSRDFNSVSPFVYRGHGVGFLPSNYCDPEIAAGRLVRLLPQWTSPAIPVFAVYPSRKFVPERLTAFLQALMSWRSPAWIRSERCARWLQRQRFAVESGAIVC